MKEPKTLIEAIKYFSDPDVCLDFVAKLRWPNGVACPTCGSTDVAVHQNPPYLGV